MEIYIPGIFIGNVIIMFFYNLFLFFSTRDKNFIFYITYIFAGGLIFLENDGFPLTFGNSIFGQIFFKGTFTDTFFFCSVATFEQYFLKTKIYSPKLHLFINLLMFCSIVLLILSHTEISKIVFKINFVIGVIGFIVFLLAAIESYKNNHKSARFFLIAHGFLAIGTILFILTHLLKLIPANQFSIYYMKCGMSLEMIFSSFALGDNLKILKEEKEISQQKVIIQLQENEDLKDKMNLELEDKVMLRTIELSNKNKEITDSITYAKRIQNVILPSQKIVKKYLENSFILYKPKDIVAGDFYWMDSVKLNQHGEEIILFAACDCTGHGVPGAMVSVICHNALNRAVREFGLTQPAAILDKTAEIVVENFSKSDEEIYDGMDISICALNTKTKTLEWAGANNSLYLVQSIKGKMQSENNLELETLNYELIETKADKQCIGYNYNLKPFTNHQFNLLPDTSIYLFTDGYADQFGGQPEKKLTKKKFKEILLSIQPLPIKQQVQELNDFISNYKQSTEQTDDILVIGVKV